MTKRDFTKVSPNVWRSNRFRKLESSDAQLLYLYFLTCEHQNSAGCFRIPDGYACADLGWNINRYVQARDHLVTGDMVSFDADAEVIYVHRWFKHSPPMNDKHAQGTMRLISEIENDDLREKVEADFELADAARQSRSAAAAASDPLSRRPSTFRNGGYQ